MDETIYYAQEGKIHTTTSGTETELSEGGYQVKIEGDACYLVNALGKPVTSAGSAGITVEDRVYKVDENGKISYVKKNPVVQMTPFLRTSGNRITDAACRAEFFWKQNYCKSRLWCTKLLHCG